MLIRVVDPAGRPVAAATITTERNALLKVGLADESNTIKVLGWDETTTTTAIDGTALVRRSILQDNFIRVGVEAEGYVPLAAAWNQGGEVHEPIPSEFTFRLERSRKIGGVVRDPSGRPVVGADVILSLCQDDHDNRARPKFDQHNEVTDSEGRWRCGHLPLRVEGLKITVMHDQHVELDLDNAALTAQLADLRALSAVFVMKPGLVVQGQITDDNGKPVPSARVELRPQYAWTGPQPTRAEVSSGTDGRYRFANCEGGWNSIFVTARGLVAQHRNITIEPGLAPIDFRLTHGHAVKIRVVDPAGKPLAAAKIIPDTLDFALAPYVADATETDRDGRWASASSPERPMPLEIIRQGYATVNPRLAAREKEYLITLRPPVRISGRVIDPITKRPIPKIHISAHPINPDDKAPALIYPQMVIDGKGQYELIFQDTLGVDQVAWQLRVQAVGYVTQVSRKFETREGSCRLDFELKHGSAVCGAVRRLDGSPVAGAKVFASTASDSWRVENGRVAEQVSPPLVCERSGADGRFELPMPSEPYVVGVIDEFGGAEIAGQELVARGEIILQPWARVEGLMEGSVAPAGEEKGTISLQAGCHGSSQMDPQNQRPRIDWSYSVDLDPSGRFAFDRVSCRGDVKWSRPFLVATWSIGSASTSGGRRSSRPSAGKRRESRSPARAGP